jgi:hypothetical protein
VVCRLQLSYWELALHTWHDRQAQAQAQKAHARVFGGRKRRCCQHDRAWVLCCIWLHAWGLRETADSRQGREVATEAQQRRRPRRPPGRCPPPPAPAHRLIASHSCLCLLRPRQPACNTRMSLPLPCMRVRSSDSDFPSRDSLRSSGTPGATTQRAARTPRQLRANKQ